MARDLYAFRSYNGMAWDLSCFKELQWDGMDLSCIMSCQGDGMGSIMLKELPMEWHGISHA